MGAPFLFGPPPPKKTASKKASERFSLELLHTHECAVCPLNDATDLRSPKMEPSGERNARVYVLSDNPSKKADNAGDALVGITGNFVRRYFPEPDDIRINYIARCHSGGAPSSVQIECCRPSIVRDIEKNKPEIIIGLGHGPLQWALNQNKISLWRGRRIPIKVGEHRCWFFPVMHPEILMQLRKDYLHFGSDEELAFKFDIARAYKALGKLPEAIVDTPKQAKADIHIVTVFSELREWFERLNAERLAGFDWETDALRPYRDGNMLTAAFAGSDYAFAFPLEHPKSDWSESQKSKAYEMIEDFLLDNQCLKVAHHLSFELEWAATQFGWDVLQGNYGDTQSQAFVLDERRGALNLNDLCQINFGLPIKTVTGNLDTLRISEMELDQALLYNGLDAKYHRKLYQAQSKTLKAEGLTETYHNALSRVVPSVALQIKGVPLNQAAISANAKEYKQKIMVLEAEIMTTPEAREFKRQRGASFRPSANPDVLFLCKTIIGTRDLANTDHEALEAIDHPLPKLILKYRSAAKMLSTYIDPVSPDSPLVYNGKLHPVLNTTMVSTSRTSSEEPNIQNWPKHDATAAQIRNQVAAKRGHKIYSFDYGGIQARNVAMESGDAKLIDSFWNDYDIHADWRDRLVKYYPRWITEGTAKLSDPKIAKAYRQRAKNEFVFASFFGAHPRTTARALGVPIEITEKLFDDFWEMFPDVKKWHEQLNEDMLNLGYVTGLSGFRRRLPISQNELINSPIQADEAIMVCDAMSRLVETGDPRFFPFLMVHDDLSFIWPADKGDKYAEYVIDTMLDVRFEWAKVVPTVVEMSVGESWGDIKEVAAFSTKTWKGKIDAERKSA